MIKNNECEVPTTYVKTLEELVRDNVSNENKKTIELVAKTMEKKFKKTKSNEYVRTRDTMVVSIALLSTCLDSDSIKTTKSGRDSLIKLLNEIKECIKGM